eukprot:3108127-Prymnesium_polylepis.1
MVAVPRTSKFNPGGAKRGFAYVQACLAFSQLRSATGLCVQDAVLQSARVRAQAGYKWSLYGVSEVA